MIACLCHALSERDAAARGAVWVTQMPRECGCRPDCGTCVAHLRELLRIPPCPPAAPPAE